jgi:hypothetical protein
MGRFMAAITWPEVNTALIVAGALLAAAKAFVAYWQRRR